MKKFRFKALVGVLSLLVCIIGVGLIAYAAPGGLEITLEDGTVWTIDNMTPVVVRDFDSAHLGDIQIDRIMYKDAPNATAVEVYRYVTKLWYHTANTTNGAFSTYELVPSKTQPVGVNTTIPLEGDYGVYEFQGWSLTEGSTSVDYDHLTNIPANILTGGEVHVYAVYKYTRAHTNYAPFEAGKLVHWSVTSYLTGETSVEYAEIGAHDYKLSILGSASGSTLQELHSVTGTISGVNNTWTNNLISLMENDYADTVNVFQGAVTLELVSDDPENPAPAPILLTDLCAVKY